ncbi:putative house-cleaning noncanonical NTP pyrophosphatase [Vibrio phage 2.275.O._10N.286.54.E11]|nr:putative house-cleaning noncanonical NTP pyrophosphatase [Vibrio phage 2.275.O._10N.286.54.E11]
MAKKGLKYKLVRDNIPNIIMEDGKTPITKELQTDKQKRDALFKKLQEESIELKNAPPKERAEEMADILEVLGAIMLHDNIDSDEVFDIRENKAKEKGAFVKFISLGK